MAFLLQKLLLSVLEAFMQVGKVMQSSFSFEPTLQSTECHSHKVLMHAVQLLVSIQRDLNLLQATRSIESVFFEFGDALKTDFGSRFTC